MTQAMIPKAVTHGPKRPLPPFRQFTVDKPILSLFEDPVDLCLDRMFPPPRCHPNMFGV